VSFVAEAHPQHTSASPEPARSCCVLLIDLIGYLRQPKDERALMRDLLNDRVGRALEGILHDRRFALDTGNGIALCFSDGPSVALAAAIRLVRLLQPHAATLPVRMGLHAGPRTLAPDTRRPDFIRDAMNVAYRIIGFAATGQLLASDEFLASHARIAGRRSPLFRYLGPSADEQGHVHELHALELAASGRTIHRQATTRPQAQPQPQPQPLTHAQIIAIERLLTAHLGPLARAQMRSQIELGLDSAALVEALSRALPAGAVRERFLRQALQVLVPAGTAPVQTRKP
jgi:class 3 adenylate cyclase